jgi:hypothetical protein
VEDKIHIGNYPFIFIFHILFFEIHKSFLILSTERQNSKLSILLSSAMFSKIIGTSSQFVMEGVKNLVVGNKVFIGVIL